MPLPVKQEDMALSPQPISTSDIAFFRNTGLALVIASLLSGAITLSLTVRENRSITLAQETMTKERAKIVTADVSGSIPTYHQE